MQAPSNPRLPKIIPPRPPSKTITRTIFGPEPTPPTRPLLPTTEPQQFSVEVERKEGGGSRRRSMPTSLQRPTVDRYGRPILKDLQEVAVTTDNSFAPSSAPATAATFSLQRVSYGPPSRTGSDASVGSAASVASSFTQNTRSMAELRLGASWDDSAIDDEDLLRGSTEQPQFRLDDPSTWARRAMGYLGQGFGSASQMPFYGYVDPKMTTSAHLQNLPNVHVPSVGMPMQPTTVAPGNLNPYMAGAVPMSGVMGPSSEQSLPATPPATVSPGVYQRGFGQPCQPWMSPSSKGSPALSSKKERRRSLTSPYSAGDSPLGHTGIVRGVGGNRKRDSLPNMPFSSALASQNFAVAEGAGQPNGGSGHSGQTTDDDALPSASLDRPPLFSGQLDVDSTSSAKDMSTSE